MCTSTLPAPRSAAASALGTATLILLITTVAACGGDGSTASAPQPTAPPAAAPPPAAPPPLTCETPPEGIQPFATVPAAVGGTIIGRTGPSFILLQAPDTGGRGFDRWLIYGPDLAQEPVITGVIYASGGVACSSNNRTAINGRDWGNGDGVYLRTEIGDGGAGATLLDGGSLRLRTTPTVSYALEPRPLPGIVPNYAISPALLANAAGSWTLIDKVGVSMSLDVAADGALTVRYRGCSWKGNLRVGDGGLYTVTAGLEPSSCIGSQWHGYTYEGVALAYPLATGGWQMVFALSVNNGIDSDDLLALGRR
jgi:hypothetical protein